MDLKKLGRYLALKRKGLNYTQRFVADKLNVSDKTVSKWEREISAPDIFVLKELSKILKISLYDLLAGKDVEKSNQEIYDEVWGIIIFYNKLNRNKYFRMFICTVFIILLFLLFILIILINISNKNYVYKIESNDKSFIADGELVHFVNKNKFIINNVSIIDNRDINNNKEDIKSFSIKLKSNDEILFSNNYSIESNTNINKYSLKRNIYSFDVEINKKNILGNNYEVCVEYITKDNLYDEINIPIKLKRIDKK